MGLRQRISGSAFNKSQIFLGHLNFYILGNKKMDGNVGLYGPLTLDEPAPHGAIIMLSDKRMGFSHSSEGTKTHKSALTDFHDALSHVVIL